MSVRGNSAHIRRKARGFALVMAMAVLTMLTVITGALAWATSTRSLSVNTRTARRQNSYALAAAVRTLIPGIRVDPIVSDLRRQGWASGVLHLSAAAVHYRIWDESAKYKYTPGRDMVLPQRLSDLGVRLRVGDSRSAIHPHSVLFEDVFRVGFNQLATFYGPGPEGRTVSEHLTLWSDGRLNVNTASDEALKQHLSGLSPITMAKVLQMRRNRPVADVGTFVSSLRVGPRERRLLLVRLTARVSCASLRLICQGPTLRSDAFAVVDLTPQGGRIRLWRDLPATGEIPAAEPGRWSVPQPTRNWLRGRAESES